MQEDIFVYFLLNYYYYYYYINSVYYENRIRHGSPSYATGRVRIYAHHPLGQKSLLFFLSLSLSVPPSDAKYATTTTTGRAQMVAARTHAHAHAKYTHTDTHARAKRHTDTTTDENTTHAARDDRRSRYEREKCLSGRLARSHSPRRHCSWAGTRRTASCPLSRKAAVTLKRGPRCNGKGATGYEHCTMQYECARKRVRVRRLWYILYYYFTSMYTPPPLSLCRTTQCVTAAAAALYHLPMPSPPYKLYHCIIYIYIYI